MSADACATFERCFEGIGSRAASLVNDEPVRCEGPPAVLALLEHIVVEIGKGRAVVSVHHGVAGTGASFCWRIVPRVSTECPVTHGLFALRNQDDIGKVRRRPRTGPPLFLGQLLLFNSPLLLAVWNVYRDAGRSVFSPTDEADDGLGPLGKCTHYFVLFYL